MVLTHNDLLVTENFFDVPRLPTAWSSLSIVQLSDLHFYEYSDPDFYQRVTDAVNELKPDLIAITGDVVHYGDQHVDKAQRFFESLHATIGKYAILGNHDYYDHNQSNTVRKTMEDGGAIVLKNDAVRLEKDGQTIWLAGLDDLWCGVPDLDKTLADVSPHECVLMLGHNPLLFDPVAYYAKKPIDVFLAGHTHAGHVYLPFLETIYRHVFKMKYRYHKHEKSTHTPEHQTQLYVSSGVGSAAFYIKNKRFQMGLPRFRYNTNPEIAIHRLYSK